MNIITQYLSTASTHTCTNSEQIITWAFKNFMLHNNIDRNMFCIHNYMGKQSEANFGIRSMTREYVAWLIHELGGMLEYLARFLSVNMKQTFTSLFTSGLWRVKYEYIMGPSIETEIFILMFAFVITTIKQTTRLTWGWDKQKSDMQ